MKTGRKQADEMLLTALACGATVDNAAAKCGLSPGIVARRLKDPKFAKRLQNVRSGMVQRTAAMLTAAATEAVRTLLELQGPNSPPAVRLNACRAIIELGSKLRETAELQERIAAVENQLQADPATFTPEPPQTVLAFDRTEG